MVVQVLALLTVNEDEPFALAEYIAATTPLLERVGGKIVERFTVNEVVVGRAPPKIAVIVAYPNREAVDALFKSEEYEQVVPARDRAFLDYSVSVIGNVEEVEAVEIEQGADQ